MKRFLLLPSLLVAAFAMGQAPPSAAPEKPAKVTDNHIEPVVTKHKIDFRGAPLEYTATAGTLPIRNDEGEVEGRMFFVAYTKDTSDPSGRPVTFAYNGGPGSSSMWLHLGMLGPRRVVLERDGSMPKPPFRMADNQETWLDKTDVVMVDAMGTGYSRVEKADLGKKFYGMRGDIAAFAEFVRTYLAKYKRFSSPIFISGESYGGIRTAGLANALLGQGIAVNGAIIISGVTNYATLRTQRGNDVPYIGYLPSMAATAWHHKRLGSRYPNLEALLGEAEKFASGEYAEALLKGSSISTSDSKSIAAKLARLTGLSEKYILNSHLRVRPSEFFKELLRDQGQTVGRLDSRFLGQDAREVGSGPEYDPADAAITPPFSSMVNEYLQRELGINRDDRYRINNYGGMGSWDYGPGGSGFPDTSEDLRQALVRNPHMRVLMLYGYYDLACPYWGMRHTVNHMDLAPTQLSRITWNYYPAGHMMYIEEGSRIQMKKDLDAFYEAALK